MKDSYTIRVDNKPLALPRDFVKWSDIKPWIEGRPLEFLGFSEVIMKNWKSLELYPNRMADKLKLYAEGKQDVEAFKIALGYKKPIRGKHAGIQDPKIKLIGALVHKIMLEPSRVTKEEKLTYEYKIALNVSKKYDPNHLRKTKLDSKAKGIAPERKTKGKSKRPG